MHVDDGIENVYCGQGKEFLNVIHMVLGFWLAEMTCCQTKYLVPRGLCLKVLPLSLHVHVCVVHTYVYLYVYLFLIR